MRLTSKIKEQIIKDVFSGKYEKYYEDKSGAYTELFEKWYNNFYTYKEREVMVEFEHLFYKRSTVTLHSGFKNSHCVTVDLKKTFVLCADKVHSYSIEVEGTDELNIRFDKMRKNLNNDELKLRKFLDQFTTVAKLLKEAPEFEKYVPNLEPKENKLAVTYMSIKELLQ